jgi:hypothetical protein
MSRLEKELLALEPEFREIRLLEYQRLDFMQLEERKIYLRNQVRSWEYLFLTESPRVKVALRSC